MSACVAVTNAEEEDSDVDAWAVELEAALDCGRVNCRRFSSRLTDILRPLDSKAVILAPDVEEEPYAAYGQSHLFTKAYAHKARTLLFTLKDAQNVDLYNRLVSGELPTQSLVRMSGPDMANPQLVRQRKEWIKKRTHEVMREGREVEGFESNLFECRNCGSSRTRYRQWRRKAVVDRTRIIIICLRCPYRWELSPAGRAPGPSRSPGSKCSMRRCRSCAALMRIGQIAGHYHCHEQLRSRRLRDFFIIKLYVNREYATQEFDFGLALQKLRCAHAASTDHDLTGQVVWLVSAFLAWYLVAHREELAGKTVVELGAGTGLSGLLASQLRAAHTALTDGNDIVLELLKENAETNADPSKCRRSSTCCCARANEPLATKFCCGFVCCAQSTEDLLYKETSAFVVRFERVQEDTFLPAPRPADVISNRELQLIVSTLDPHKANNWDESVTFGDDELKNMQIVC
ncbi:unnamed protein product [Hyaloperonospora brassicae]|uniref:TFIIS central domain-containing protein n=1 Tax=Hyaloperonospora brassicae TaxID=162125 RepID=A0AAV0UME5_HYABA|nr:unnamed protein product [Hyaloperonospora brassicae]